MAEFRYPPVGFHFRVEFSLPDVTDNDNRFRDVSGLSYQVDTEELREGGENRFIHQLPTRVDFQSLTLKRGMITDSIVIEWVRNTLENFEFVPIDVMVSLLGSDHQPIRSWQIKNAWPKKWTISDFNAQENNIVIETLELEYNNFRIIQP